MHGLIDRYRLALAAAIALSLILAPGSGIAPIESACAAPVTQNVSAEIVQPAPIVHSGEAVSLAVTVSLSAPAEYLEVRLRLRTAGGRLIFQKTEVRSEVSEGRHTVEFERSAEGPALEQGRYPVEVRILATGSEPTHVTGRVLVIDPGAEPQQVAIVARTWAMPVVGPDGRFTVDPAAESGLRQDLTAVATTASSRRAHIGLILAPVLLEELGRTAAGYQTTDGAPVPAEADVPVQAAETLAAISTAREAGFLDLLDTPYALPDHAGLAEIGAEPDLEAHWTRADSVTLAALRASADSPTAYLGQTLTPDAIASLAPREATAVVAPATSFEDLDGELAAGLHPLGGTDVVAIVPDEDGSAALDLGATEFYDLMFDRIDTGPVVLIVDIGPGASGNGASVERALELVERSGWLELAPIGDLRPADDAQPVELCVDAVSDAPASHWENVSAARRALLAYREAVGAEDADVESLSRALLVTESELWAGTNGSWSGAGRARGLAESVSSFIAGEFEKISFDAKDVTLSGTTGDVPFTLVNNTGKHLALTIVATFTDGSSGDIVRRVEVDPMENFVTMPIDLRNSMSSDLEVTVRSGDLVVARTDVTVHASYIDRLGTVAMVVLVLLVLLLVIRRRIGRPNAATIDEMDSPSQE